MLRYRFFQLSILITMVLVSGCATHSALDSVRDVVGAADAVETIRGVNATRSSEIPLAGTYRMEIEFPDTTAVVYARTALTPIAPIPTENEKASLSDRFLNRDRTDLSRGYFAIAVFATSADELDRNPAPGFLWVNGDRSEADGSTSYQAMFTMAPDEVEGSLAERFGDYFGDAFEELVWTHGGEYPVAQDESGAVTIAQAGTHPETGQQAALSGTRVDERTIDMDQHEDIGFGTALEAIEMARVPDNE